MKNRFRQLKGQIMDRDFIAFDIETYISGPNKGRFLFGGCFDGHDYIYFTDRLKMKRFLTSTAFLGKTFIAHNAEYDLNRIFLEDSRLERYYTGSRLVFAKVAFPNGKKKRYINYWDSFNYTFRSLADVGELIGLPKYTDYISNEITPKQLEANERDCKIIYKFITGFQETINKLGGNLRSTLAGCGMDVYRRGYMPDCAQFWQLPDSVKADFREAYFGGRTEVFNLNKFKNVYYYDINASYAYAMTFEFPLLDTWVNKPDLLYEGCTFCKITMPEMYYPLLPVRAEKVIFPIGKWAGWYYNNELRYALAQGARVEPLRGYHYTRTFPVFKDFILDMQKQKKKSGDKFEYSIFKTLMNSLYGRFAMRGGLERFQGDTREMIAMNSPAVNVIWSGMIAARGRIELHKLITKSKAVYCDTDSSITQTILKTNEKIGGIGLKSKFQYFKANAPKDYEYNENGKTKRKIKGVPSRALEIDHNHYQYEVPIKYKSAKRRKIALHKWILVDKRISSVYDKRVVLKDGTTEPLQIGG